MRSAMLMMVGVAIGFLLGAGTFELINRDALATTRDAEQRAALAASELVAARTETERAEQATAKMQKFASASAELLVDGSNRAVNYWSMRAGVAEKIIKRLSPETYEDYMSKMPPFEMRYSKEKAKAVTDALKN